jgi:hypothetical protein
MILEYHLRQIKILSNFFADKNPPLIICSFEENFLLKQTSWYLLVPDVTSKFHSIGHVSKCNIHSLSG